MSDLFIMLFLVVIALVASKACDELISIRQAVRHTDAILDGIVSRMNCIERNVDTMRYDIEKHMEKQEGTP